MIVKNVDNDAGILMIPRRNPQLIPSGNQVHVGKGIDITVQSKSLFHLLRENHIIPSLYIITHKIPNNDFLIVSGQVCMCQKVQFPNFLTFNI